MPLIILMSLISAKRCGDSRHADTQFPDHLKRYQREHNDCCWGLVLLPSEEAKQIAILKRIKAGKLKHPIGHTFNFESARWENLFINLRDNPPEVGELCDCEWEDELCRVNSV